MKSLACSPILVYSCLSPSIFACSLSFSAWMTSISALMSGVVSGGSEGSWVVVGGGVVVTTHEGGVQ